MLIVNPWDWLHEDGTLPTENPRLRRRMLRIARFIEYGGPLRPLHARETLLECKKRPGRQPCLGLMWVIKTEQDAIYAYCLVCGNEEAMIHHWQDTDWAEGMMEEIAPDDPTELH